MGYIGNEPTTGHFPVDNFTSSGGSTYTLAKAPASAGAIEVSVQGVLQPTTAYTVSGSTLTMAGVTTGVKIFVRHLGETLSLPTPADGSVTTAKLGTNSVDGTKIAMGSDARGDILYHGATDYARLAKGTSGQVLTMGANDPAWAAAGGGAWTLIKSTTASTSSSIDFVHGTGGVVIDSTYQQYVIVCSSVVCGGGGVTMQFRVSDDGGTSFETSNYSYHLSKGGSDGASEAYSASNSIGYIRMHEDLSSSAGTNWTGIVYLNDPSNSSLFTQVHWEGVSARSTSIYTRADTGAGAWNVVTAVNGIRFLPSGGTITSGRFTLYGIAHA